MQEELSPENKKALAEGRARAMTQHGVGLTYHKRSLTSLRDGGARLVKWFNEDAMRVVPDGGGITFVGAGLEPRESAILTARALNLKGVETFVVALTSVVRWLDRPASGGDYWREVMAAQALVLTGVVSFTKSTECYMTEWQVKMVEDYLSQRITNGQAVFPVAEVSLADSNWYSGEFTELVASKNLEFKV